MHGWLALAAVMPGALTAQTRSPTPRPIFREVTFAPYDALRLGERPKGHTPGGEPRGTDRVVLPAGFGGTDSITLHFAPDDRIVAMDFAYPYTTAYPAF